MERKTNPLPEFTGVIVFAALCALLLLVGYFAGWELPQ